jgi:hypothetical protein
MYKILLLEFIVKSEQTACDQPLFTCPSRVNNAASTAGQNRQIDSTRTKIKIAWYASTSWPRSLTTSFALSYFVIVSLNFFSALVLTTPGFNYARWGMHPMPTKLVKQ